MKVFIIPFHVKPMDNSIMPSGFPGAYVRCYSPGNDYVEATKKSLKKLLADNIHPEEILQPIYEMNSDDWSRHVADKWPELASSLLNQQDFESAMKRDEVVYGPFGLYE